MMWRVTYEIRGKTTGRRLGSWTQEVEANDAEQAKMRAGMLRAERVTPPWFRSRFPDTYRNTEYKAVSVEPVPDA